MPRISADSVEQHREQVHRQVFDAFAALSQEQSVEAIRMSQLAERAGLGRTAIYHHFRDVESVVVAFATHETVRYLTTLRARLAETDQPSSQLRLYVQHHLGAGEQFHLGLGRNVYGLLSDDSRLAIREHVRAVETVLRDVLVAGVETGEFEIDDLDGTISLIHVCLTASQVAIETTSDFVLRAVQTR